MLEDTGRRCSVLKELRAVFLTGHREPDRVLCHRNRTVSDKAIETEPRDLHHLMGRELYDRLLHRRRIGSLGPEVLVIDVPVLIAVHGHAVWHQRIQRCDFSLAVSDDLHKAITPQKKVCHEGLPEGIGCHLLVRLAMEKEVQRMVRCLYLAAILFFVEVKRQAGHSFCKHPDAGIHSGDLHGASLCHGLPGRSMSVISPVHAPGCHILRIRSHLPSVE